MRRGTRPLVALAGALAIAVASAGCGGGDANPLSDAEQAMASLDSGRIDLTLAATAPSGSGAARPVGFRMEGPFAIEAGRDYPTLDVRYTTLLGDDEHVTRVVSDGTSVDVIHDGYRTELPAEDARRLRLGRGGDGFADLGVAGWVEDPTIVERPDGTRLVTGTVDVADLLSDLARISGQTGGGGNVDALDGDSSERIRGLVRHSEFTAELDRGDLPRSLRAVVDFGLRPAAELKSALGAYAAPRLEVSLAVEPAAGPR
ncbi:MAG TPA: hypothetical protein VFS16_02620 [Acidimicrobiia bacterium]|nr:hypothetical protein [Acidimicrobiia bacterium]